MKTKNVTFSKKSNIFKKLTEAWSEYGQELKRINEAACKIQSAWRNAIGNPSYKLCKIRLLHEFDEFQI